MLSYFFLSFIYKYILQLVCNVESFGKNLTFLHPSTIRQTETSKNLALNNVKIQIRLHKSSTKLFFQRDLVQSE